MRLFGDVQFDEQGAGANLRGQGFAGHAVDVGEHHAGALGGQQQGIGLADAAGGAGDQYDFVLHAFHAGLLGGSWPTRAAVIRAVLSARGAFMAWPLARAGPGSSPAAARAG
ncbi:hypothetical protein FQZ97_888290 [compost metagenome]